MEWLIEYDITKVDLKNEYGGGFVHHNVVTDKNVNLYYKTYKMRKGII